MELSSFIFTLIFGGICAWVALYLQRTRTKSKNDNSDGHGEDNSRNSDPLVK